MPQMNRHFRLKSTLYNGLGELLEKTVFSDQIFRFLLIVVRKQMIEQLFVNGHIMSLLRVGCSTTP